MSGILGLAATAEIALSAATAKTVLQVLAPTNHRVKIVGWGVYFDGVSVVQEPVQIELLRQSTAGTMSALTPEQVQPVSETIQTQASHTATAEPTAQGAVDMIECHPQQGYEVKYPMGQEIIVPGGGRVGIKITSPAIVNVRAKFFFDE